MAGREIRNRANSKVEAVQRAGEISPPPLPGTKLRPLLLVTNAEELFLIKESDEQNCTMLATLKQAGWVALDGIETISDMLKVARTLGRPLSAPTGEVVKALAPVESHMARPGSLSSDCGLGEFPFHTDLAFWPRPCRYLVMLVVGDRRRPTRILHFEHVLSMLGPRAHADILRSVWRTRQSKGGIYCSMNFSDGSSRGWRFDSTVMSPTNASSRRTLEDFAFAIRDSQQKVTVSWERTNCIVIDNWQVLHARGDAPVGELSRVLYRIYVE
jgi:hypothetical protein